MTVCGMYVMLERGGMYVRLERHPGHGSVWNVRACTVGKTTGPWP
jgi:hypothetical protein